MDTKTKNIVVFFGSPHKDSYTAKLLNLFIKKKLDNSNYKINIIYAYNENIHACIDCKFCRDYDFCIFKDLDNINNLLIESDFIIIASPIYNASFPSPLKSILDRFQIYYYYFQKHRKSIFEKPKNLLLLLTQGSKNINYNSSIKSLIKPICNILNIKSFKIINVTNTDNK